MSTKAGLTLGIEIEFLLIGRKDASDLVYTTADPTKPLTAIKQILQPRLPDVPFNTVSKDGHYENWTVTSDSSITLLPSKFVKLPEDYFMQDVELISPIFSYHDDDWDGEPEQILHVLHELFNTTEPTFPFRLLVNETCGLHIHVGASKGQNRRFPLSTLSKLFQIVTGFERLLSEMHPTSRQHEPACKTLSQFFRRRRASPTTRPRSGPASHPLA